MITEQARRRLRQLRRGAGTRLRRQRERADRGAAFSAPPLHPSEGAAAAAVAPPAEARAGTSLAALLAGHILRDGETVVLILRPSFWFITFAAARFAAVVLLLVLLARLSLHPRAAWAALEGGLFLVAGRVMWGVLQWMGRLYVLTDLRVLRLAGVFTIDIFDCPLRRVAQTRPASTLMERAVGVGSIEIIPTGDDGPVGDWRTIRHPKPVLEKINRMVHDAQHGGGGGGPCRL